MAREDTETPDGPLAAFCARLKRLQHASGLTQTAVAGHAGMGKSQMSAILNGAIKQLPDWEVVRIVVHACLDYAARTGRELPADLRDERDWQRRYGDLEQDMEVAERPRRATELDGRPISQWDPFILGVHRPIAAARRPASGQVELPALPPYVLREHDQKLRELLDPSRSGPRMVVLVGGSCTGKTRAAYEAVSNCLPGWRLVRPETGGDLVRLLADRLLSSQSVLWLNETQTYLDGDDGEAAAAALRRLLSGPLHIQVVGTMWDTDWRYLTERPKPEHPGHPQARELLDQSAVKVMVPANFSGHALMDLMQAARNDPRLAEAAHAASETGQIAQLIAGGPWLLDFYRHEADPYTKAVIDAAIGAWLVGHHAPLPASMLEEAAAGYLADHQRAVTTGWFDDALARATEKIKGAVAPLSPIRTRRGAGKPDGYLLADYLLQYAHIRSGPNLKPIDLWDALASHVSDVSDHVRIAQAALKCNYKRHALLHFRSAIQGARTDHDTVHSVHVALDHRGTAHGSALLSLTEASEEFIPSVIARKRTLAQREAPYRDIWTTATRALASLLSQAGQIDEAAELQRRLAERIGESSHDYREGMPELATVLEQAGRFDEAEEIWRSLVTGDQTDDYDYPMRMLASLLARTGRITEAIDVSQHLSDRDNSYAMEEVAEQLESAGKLDEAAAVWQRLAARDDSYAMRILAGLLEKAGRIDDALAVWQPAALSGTTYAKEAMAGLLERAGRIDEAVAIWQSAAEGDDIYAMRHLAALLERAGQMERAIAVWQPAASRGDMAAMEVLAGLLERAGQTDEAIVLRERLAALDESDDAKRKLAALLERAGCIDEAVAMWQPAAEEGNTSAIRTLAKLLTEAGRIDVAEWWLRVAVEHGDAESMTELLALLRVEGRADEAEQILKFGLEPGGRTADPWL
jgi:tetratricopeptide (TPR) repeat protein/transcriptional regulator with XRE-family HTH domain